MRMSPEAEQRLEREEAAYWRQREELLGMYEGRWVAVVGGEVVAVGDKPGSVIQEAVRKTGSTSGFVTCVGHEEAHYRIRRTVGRPSRAVSLS